MKLFELEARPYQEKEFPRSIMPQIRKEHLIDSPFDFQTGEIPITKLKPVQSERVKGMHDRAKRGFDDGTIRPIIIDNDNFIVNGHHRYDIARGMDMEDVDVIKVDATIEELIKHYSNTADKQPTIEDKWKKNLKKKIKKMPKKISGSSSNILFNLGLAETIEAGQDFNALLQGIESDLKQREKDLKRLPKKSIYSEGEVVSGSEAFPTYELWKFPKDIKVNSEKLIVTQNLEEIEKYLRSQPSSISHIFKVAKNGSYMDLPEFNINSKFANAPTNEDVSQLKPQTSGTKRPLFSPQRSQKAYQEWLNGAAVDTDIEIIGNDNQRYYIRQNTDGESQHFVDDAWYLTDADYEIVDTEGYEDPGDLLFSHSATGYEPIDPDQIDENFPIPPTNDKLLQKIRDWQIRGHHGDRGTATGDSELFSMCHNYLMDPDKPMAGKLEVIQKIDLAMDMDSSETPTEKDVYDYIRNSGVDMPFNPLVGENFKDGKKPGRKGLAKRSGVNTKASVSSLRKTAKNSTGEKQRMAHWLANMKSGKKKSK